MTKQQLQISRGMKKFIRKQKARIRREVEDTQEQKKMIDDLYNQVKEAQTSASN